MPGCPAPKGKPLRRARGPGPSPARPLPVLEERMSSYRQSVQYSCSACSHQGTVDTWLVVDVTERPDLVESISDGSIRRFTCEACGARQAATTSLLLGRPGQRPEPLWAPDPG